MSCCTSGPFIHESEVEELFANGEKSRTGRHARKNESARLASITAECRGFAEIRKFIAKPFQNSFGEDRFSNSWLSHGKKIYLTWGQSSSALQLVRKCRPLNWAWDILFRTLQTSGLIYFPTRE